MTSSWSTTQTGSGAYDAAYDTAPTTLTCTAHRREAVGQRIDTALGLR